MSHKFRLAELLLYAATAALIIFTVCRFQAANADRPLVLRQADSAGEFAPASSLLNLNTASAQELDSLPGIGPALAEKILLWRQENGSFTCREDVLAVSGIGESTYEDIAPYITY